MLRILVVDDNRTMANSIVDILRAKGYDAFASYSGADALERLWVSEFDCILSDIKMPNITGVDLFKRIKEQGLDIPVVLMTGGECDDLIEEGVNEGVVGVLDKPLNFDALFSFFSYLRRVSSVVIIDDDPQFCRTLGDVLRAYDFDVIEITDPASILDELNDDTHLVLLDMKLTSTTGLEVLREIREHHPRLPVVLATGYPEEMVSFVDAAEQLGVHAYFEKPFSIDDFVGILKDIRRQEMCNSLM